MSRWVIPTRVGPGAELAGAQTEPPDGLLGRLVKYVPAEVLTLYLAAYGGVASVNPEPETARQIVVALAAIFLSAAVVWTARSAPRGAVRRAHLWVVPFAFLVWAYSVSSSLLGTWFVGWIAILGQVSVVLMARAMAPLEVTPVSGSVSSPPNAAQ
jgi:hypothetical protein